MAKRWSSFWSRFPSALASSNWKMASTRSTRRSMEPWPAALPRDCAGFWDSCGDGLATVLWLGICSWVPELLQWSLFMAWSLFPACICPRYLEILKGDIGVLWKGCGGEDTGGAATRSICEGKSWGLSCKPQASDPLQLFGASETASTMGWCGDGMLQQTSVEVAACACGCAKSVETPPTFDTETSLSLRVGSKAGGRCPQARKITLMSPPSATPESSRVEESSND
mmetsp:Transcript_63232/g.184761  ORF Transcript_63232/g.184761 Transcript_63232/m.184761 type:complete len:226 (-) Transcript_63232:825-1502(-)